MPANVNFKRTKIVATIGPATSSEEMIRDLAQHGVNIFRINFSHSNDEEHVATIAAVKKVRAELDLPLAILQDLQAPRSVLAHSVKDHVKSPQGASLHSPHRLSMEMQNSQA